MFCCCCKGVSDDVTDAGDIHLRKDCTAADETAVEEQIEGKEAEEFYDDQEPLTGTDVEILSRDENNENFAEYSSETGKNGEGESYNFLVCRIHNSFRVLIFWPALFDY